MKRLKFLRPVKRLRNGRALSLIRKRMHCPTSNGCPKRTKHHGCVMCAKTPASAGVFCYLGISRGFTTGTTLSSLGGGLAGGVEPPALSPATVSANLSIAAIVLAAVC
jgi:hypothetical protein